MYPKACCNHFSLKPTGHHNAALTNMNSATISLQYFSKHKDHQMNFEQLAELQILSLYPRAGESATACLLALAKRNVVMLMSLCSQAVCKECAHGSCMLLVAFDDSWMLHRLPFKLPRNEDRPPGYVDWLYLDDNLRITQGSKGSLFVHTREELE